MTCEKANKLSQLCNSPTEKPQERSWGWGQHIESLSCSLQVWGAGSLLSGDTESLGGPFLLAWLTSSLSRLIFLRLWGLRLVSAMNLVQPEFEGQYAALVHEPTK